MKKTRSYTVLNIIVLTIILFACSKDFEFDKIKTDNFNAEWGVPLVSSKLTLENFLNDTSGIINVNPDGLISLIYESEKLLSVQARDRTKIPDQYDEEMETFEIPQPPQPIPPGTYVQLPAVYFNITFELEDQNQRIDSLYLTNGLYTITLLTNLNRDSANVHLTVPNFINMHTGIPLQRTFNISNPNEIDTIALSTTINLFDYYVNFDNDPENTIIIQADIGILTDDNPFFIAGYFLILENDLKDIDYSKYYGYIGEHVESYTDTIDLSIYNSSDFGSITYGPNCVKLSVGLDNELGLPIKVEAEKFTAYHTTGSTRDSTDIFLITDTGDTNNFTINSPVCNSGSSVFTDVQFDNSNIVEALDISPNKMFFKLNGILNYDRDSTETNCFRDTSDFTMSVKLQLDLFGNISEFRITDTIDFSIESVENLNALDLRILFSNGFPITASAKLDFLDNGFNHLYSLFTEGEEEIIISAETGGGPDYKVIQPTVKETIISLDGEAMELVLQSSKIVFTSTLSTEPGKLVKIYSDYSLDMSLSAKFYVNY